MSNQTFKIDKVLIPGLTTPVLHPENPEGGIALSLLTLIDVQKGPVVQVVIDPWFNMSEYDHADVLTNKESTPAVSKTIQPGEENKRISLFLPVANLQNDINRIRLRVKRISQDPETSEDLVVLFNTPRPGDEVSGTGDNPNLIMTLPADVIDKGLDADRVAEGVEVKLNYFYMRAHDNITLDCDGHIVLHTVTEAQAVAGTIVLKLFADAFKNDKPEFPMRFKVVDQIGNSSGPQAIWSPTTHIDVHIRRPALDLKPPIVLEAKEENGTVLNFEKDFYEAKFAKVTVDFTGSAPNQTVKIYWVGRNSTYGSEIQTVAYAGQVLTFLVSRLEVVDCIGSGAEISYTVRLPDTTEDLSSKALDIRITGQKHHLPEPTLSSDKLNLRAYYPALEGAYKVRLALFGREDRLGEEVAIRQPSYTNLPVLQAWIEENRGLKVIFNYTLKKTDTDEPIIFSWRLRVAL
jgi:hypothetical protein